MGALKGPKEGMPSRLLAVCVLYACLAAASAFAPLVHAPSTARSRVALDLRASAPVSRRAVLDESAKLLLGGAAVVGVMPSGALAKATKASAEDTVAAWNSLVDAIEKLDKGEVGPLVESQDWNSILALMDEPEFAKIEDNLLKLVNGPILNADDKKTIGTRKRYGIAADVIYGVGGVKGAIANIDDPQIESCKNGICSGSFVDVNAEVPKSLNSLKASLSEVLQICKQYKEFVRSE